MGSLSVPAVSNQWGLTPTEDGTATLSAALGRLRAAREDPGAAVQPEDPGSPATPTEGPPAPGGPGSLADDLRARLEDRRATTTAAHYSAAAYAALHGHVPGGDDDELDRAHGGRRRWALRPRTALVALGATLLLGTGVAVAASWPGGDVEELAAVSSSGTPGPAAPATAGRAQEGLGERADATPAPAPAPSAAAEVVIDVVGQVHTPGLLTLPAGSRVADAVTAAGGATDGAELSAVNLARPLVDGEQLRIPAPGEAVAPAPALAPAAGGGSGPSTTTGGLINLNTADGPALETLPGVGVALAGRILQWREQNGAFASVDELDEVSGIGPAMLAKLRDLVTV